MKEDLSGEYFPLVGMKAKVRQQLVEKHFIFASGDKNLIAAGMERGPRREKFSTTTTRSVLQAVLLKSMSISNIHFLLPVESKNTRRDKEDCQEVNTF